MPPCVERREHREIAKPQERPNPFDPAGAHQMAAWHQLGLRARQAYNCVGATHQMAGHNNMARTEGLRSELTAKIQRTSDQLGTRIESQGRVLSARIDRHGQQLSAKIDRHGQELSARIDRHGHQLSARIENQGRALRAEIARLDQRLGAEVDRLVGAFRVQQSMIWALIGILAMAVLGILAAMLLSTQAVPAHSHQPSRTEATQSPVKPAPEHDESAEQASDAREP